MKALTACLVCAVMFSSGAVAGMLVLSDYTYQTVQAESMFLGAEAGAKAEAEHYFSSCTQTLSSCVELEDTMERRFAACVSVVGAPHIHR